MTAKKNRRVRLARSVFTLTAAVAASLLAAAPAWGQSFTNTVTGFSSNIQNWNFGAGPGPVPSGTTAITVQSFGTGVFTWNNDFNLLLNSVNLNMFGATAPTNTVSGSNAGTITFGAAGGPGAAFIRINGTGGTPVWPSDTNLSSLASSLTISGAGGSGLNLTGQVGSSTSTGAPINISTSGSLPPNVNAVLMSGGNTFAGGVVLNSGNLNVTGASALGILLNNINTLTVNGGSFQGNQTLPNNVLLNSTLTITGGNTGQTTTFGGNLTGAGGLVVRPIGNTQQENFQGINTYMGATTIGQITYAPFGNSPQGAGDMRILGSVGQVPNSPSFSIADGGILEVNKGSGDSIGNNRVNAGSPINVVSGFVQVIGSTGLTTQNFGTVTGTGATTILANTSGGANSSTIINIPNLIRNPAAGMTRGTFVFAGTNLGNAAAAAGSNNANIFLTQINGAAPSAALVGGGGGAGSAQINILPYGLGDTATGGSNFGAGTGFVTYGTNGVRLLDPATEYNNSNDFTTNGAFDNMRTSAAVTFSGNSQVNSLFNTSTAAGTPGGTTLTIISGALASNATGAVTYSGNIVFGVGGTGEAIVSVLGGLNSSNTLTANGALTGSTLTKTGHGILVLGSTSNNFSSNLVTVNAGVLQIAALSNLGIANSSNSSLVFNMHFWGGATGTNIPGGLIYTGTGGETLNVPITINSGHMNLRMAGANGQLTLGGMISGNGGLNIDPSAAGTVVTLSGANTFMGGMRLGGSGTQNTFRFANDASLGNSAGPITINSAGMTVQLQAPWTTSRNIAMDGALGQGALAGAEGFDTAGFGSTWSGVIAGTGGIFKISSGAADTWTITGANNPYTGTIQLGTDFHQGGTLALSGAGDLNSASIQFGNGATSVAGTYVLDISAATGPVGGTPWRSFANITTPSNFTRPHSIQLGANSGAPVDIRIGAGVLGDTNSTVGTITGFGKVVKVGSGTFSLRTTNTFTGDVEIWGGTLLVSKDDRLGVAGNNIALMGGTLQLIDNTNGLPISSNRGISLSPTTIPVNSAIPNGISITNTFGVTLNGNITGPGGFEKTGAGSALTLTGTNTYGGNTRLTAGTTIISSDSNIGGATSNLILNGGTLQTAAASTVTIARTTFVTAASTVNVGGISLQFNGPFIGSQNITTAGVGALTLNNPSPLYLGTITVGSGAATGNLILTSNFSAPRANLALAASSGANLSMLNQTKEFGGLATDIGTTVDLGNSGSLTFGFNNLASTLGGTIVGGATASVFKTGNALTTIQNSVTSAGGFHVLYSGGVTLSSTAAGAQNGTIGLQTAMTVGAWGNTAGIGPTLTLDNTNATADRIANGQAMFINSGGLTFTTNTTTASTEIIDSLLGSGYTTVTMTTGGTLNFANTATGLTRVNRGTFLMRAGSTMFGSQAASTTVPNLIFGNINAGSLFGTPGGTGNQTPILPYVVSNDTGTAASTGNTFATYDTTFGIRPLNTGTEYLNTFTGSTATTNVRTGASTTFNGADGVANCYIFTGTANAGRLDSTTTEKLIISSGGIANTVTQVYNNAFTPSSGLAMGIQVAELQTGAANTRELIVHNLNADLNIGARITTSGGLTKSGTGQLFLTNSANTYTGGTTINGGNLVIDSFGAVNNFSAPGLTLGGGYLKYRGGDAILPGLVTLGGGSALNPGMGGGINVVSGTNLTAVTNTFSGFGGLYKDGTGTLTLLGTNNFSGAVILQAGQIAIDGPAALGTNPRVLIDASAIAATGAAGFRFLNSMTVSKDFAIISGTATVGVHFDVPTAGNNATLSGVISSPNNNTRGITKIGDGDLTLTGANIYTGVTHVFGGNLILAGPNGSALASTGSAGAGQSTSINTFQATPGGTLVLDNRGTGNNNNNRIPDVFSSPYGVLDAGATAGASGTIGLIGGNFTIRGNATVPTNEVVNRVEVRIGTITLENNGAGTILTSGRMFRTAAQSAALIRGDNLGGTPGAGSTNWFNIDMAGAAGTGGATVLGGARGAVGTPFVSIVPGFMGDRSSTGIGTDLVTYDANVGFRPLIATEYASTIPVGNLDFSRAPNVELAASAIAAVPVTTQITGLKLNTGSAVNGGGNPVLLQSTVLAVGNSSINTPSLGSAGNGGYDILVPGSANLTVNSALSAGTAAVSKYGAGTMTLTNVVMGSGAFVVAQGALQLSGPNAALNPLFNVVVYRGATFDLGGSDRAIGGLAENVIVGSNNLTVQLDGTVNLGANTLTLLAAANGGFTGQIMGTGGLTLGNFSVGFNQFFMKPQTYSGPTKILGGGIILTNGGTLANTSLIDIRGGTLTVQNANDNVAGTGYIAQRISSTTPINLAGSLTIGTANPDTPANHQFGTLNLVGGGTVSATAGTSAPTTLTFNDLTRATNRGVLTVTGTNLGLAQSPIGNTRILFNTIAGGAPASALVGGGGAAGTTNVSILPWAWNTNNGGFVTYGANGLRPLNTVAAPTAGAEVESNLDAPLFATSNMRTTAAANITADREINSLVQTGGNVTGAGGTTLTIGSGAMALITTASTVSVPNLRFGPGTANNAEAVIFNSVAATISSTISTTGGLTKYGAGTLTLSGTNSYTGPTAIHGGLLQFAAANNLGSTSSILMGQTTTSFAFSTAVIGLQYTGTTSLDVNQPITLSGYGGISATNNNLILALNGNIDGPGGLTINQALSSSPIIELNGMNSYGGSTNFAISSGNIIVSILNDSSLGSGNLINLDTVSTAPLMTRGDWTTSKYIRNVSGYPIHSNDRTITMNGLLLGSSLNKQGGGSLILTQPSPMTGTITANGGEVRYTGRGATIATAAANNGATVTLDNSGTQFGDRLPDSGTVTLTNGLFNFIGNVAATSEEVISAVSLGASSLNVGTITAGNGQAAIVRLGGATPLSRSASSALLLRGTNLGGAAPGSANTASVVANSPLVLYGGLSGANAGTVVPAGSTATPVIPGAMGDTDPAGFGSVLLTYDLVNGVRPLTTAEFATTLNNGTTFTNNVRLTSGTSIANATAVNSLWLDNGGGLNAGGGTLTISSGNLLVSAGNTGIAGTIGAGGTVLTVGGAGDLMLTGVVSSANQTGGLAKLGSGNLTLTQANTFTGGASLFSGTLTLGNATALGTNTVNVMGGTLAASTAGLTFANGFTLNGTLTMGGSNDYSLSGAVSINNATRTIVVPTGRTLTQTSAGVISSTGPGISLIKDGPGTLILNGVNTYASGAASNNFYESKTIVNGGELSVRNTTGSGTGGSRVIVNNGGTLSGTGFIVPAQTQEARNTVTINTGGTIKPGTSPGVLTIGSGVTLGATTATVAMNAGSRFSFQYTAPVTSANADTGGSAAFGTGNNYLVVNGSLNVDPGAIFKINGNFSDYTINQPYSFQVSTGTNVANFNITNPAQFDTSNFTGFIGASSFQWHNVGNIVYFNFTPVPEPLHLLLVCGAGAAGFRWYRRRQLKKGN